MVALGFDWLVSGVVLGGLYALMASGLTLVWGTVGILNFAHGAFITMSAYVVWLFSLAELGYVPGLLTAVSVAFALGVLVELIIFRPLRNKPNAQINFIYGSLGAAIVLEMLMLLWFGPRRKVVPEIFPGSITVGGLFITYNKLTVILVAAVTLTSFYLFIKKTRWGMAMRAVAQDEEATQLLGINLNRVYLLTIGLGSAIAGVSGVFLGSIYFVWPTFGDIPLIKGFIIIVFGGLGSIRGTILASFILGLAEAVAALLVGLSWVLPVLFLFMMGTLILKPSGLLGEKV